MTAGGYQVDEARNGSEGLLKLDTETYACVVTDLLMPEMDGFVFLEELSKRPAQVPVVVLSSDIQRFSREKCRQLGAKAFLNKPPKVEELLGVLEAVLDRACLISG